MKNRLLSACLLMGLSVLRAVGAETNSGPHSIPELQKAIESILKETKTPGAAIAIITSNQVEWLAGIGKADVAANLPVTKASGERFEDYMQKHVFPALHMDGASYFYTPEVQRRLAKLYRPET